MRETGFERSLVVVLCLLLVALPLPAVAQPNCQPSSVEPFVDNRDGYLVNFEEPPIHPLELSYNGRRLYAANIPDGRVSVFDITTPGSPRLIREVAVGLGPVSLRRRPPQGLNGPVEPHEPGPVPATAPLAPLTISGAAIAQPAPIERQLWVVCMSSNAIFILDEVSLRVIDSVRLTHRPADVVFDASGKTAYVSLSDSNQVAVVKADNPHVAPTLIEFESEMPLGSGVALHVEEPRALLRDGADVYALSFLSGNGSTAATLSLFDPFIAQQWDFWPGEPEPPDRDVLRLDLSGGTPGGTAALWRMGTVNFDLAKGGPDGHFWVSSLDMRNLDVQLQGEPEYQQEPFALHTVSHAAPSVTGTPQSGTVVIDLNDPANHAPGLHTSFRCAVPNDLHFTADGNRLFVACNDSRSVAMLDTGSDQVTAEFKVGAGSRAGFGIRGVLLDRSERWLYAYGRGDSTLLAFDTQTLVAGPNPPQAVLPLGWDITPANVVAGRFHFLDASNSNDGLSTCNTCHIDGHLDGSAWDLSDVTGDTTSDPRDVPRVPKGAKVTMSLLGIEETPPFHWRGDRADLDAFNPAFEGLLGGSLLDETPGGDLDDFLDFVFSLSYPPSPHQQLDRTYTTAARLGFDCFEAEVAHDVGADANGTQISVSCERCHSMAGGSATLNQVNNPVSGLLADDATQLRGIWDKVSETVDYGPVITCPGSPYCVGFLNDIPATGWGVANTGFVDTLLDFINLNVFSGLPAGSQVEIEKFILQLDTGSAPTTAATHQLDGSLAGGGALPTPLAELVAGTGGALPANDLIVRGWITHQGAKRSIGMLYDPLAAPSPVFVTDTVDNIAAGCTADASVAPGANGIGPFSLGQLDAMVAAGDAVLTAIGTPVGSGYRLGLDRDLDCLRDGDEAAHGTVASNPDFDGDTFPDGYEVRLGSDPTLLGSVPTDNVAPVVPAGGSAVAWKNSNVMKVRWETDEESRSRLRVLDTTGVSPVLVFDKTESQFKRRHVMVARGLEPGRSYSAEVETEDPRNNRQTFPVGGDTTQSHLFLSVHVDDTVLTHLGPSPTTPGLEQYRVDFHLDREDNSDSTEAEVSFTLVEWVPGQGSCPSNEPGGPCEQTLVTDTWTAAGGIASRIFDGLLDFQGQGGFTEAFATDVSFANTGTDDRLYFHSLDGQCGHWHQVGVNGLTPVHPCL